jgi:GntR family transcriptional regulator / MocR family aminotransferase
MKERILSEWLLTQLNQHAFPARMPNHRKIYEAIRRAITEQILPSGSRLPSSRDLATDLQVSRNTILAAFDQLLDEGYVEAKTGSGTYISYKQTDAAFSKMDNVVATPISPTVQNTNHIGLSKRGFAATHSDHPHSHEVQPFTPGDDDYSRFPIALWRRLLNRHWRALNPTLLDSSHDGGYWPLRQAIAEYLRISRAVILDANQVIITSGTQQSIDLCARLLTDHGDAVWVENPCYWAARRVLESNGLTLHPIQVDKEGMAPSTADFRQKPKLIYTTPSHQYPKGMVMSYGRRRLLLDYAQNCQAWMIEDDYDSEFRFEGRPISSLQGMDVHGRVLYLGTFSKVMYPGIRLGYMVVPPSLVTAFKNGLYELQRPGQVMIQAALADFIEEGYFASHIRRLRQTYGERRRLLQKSLASISSVGARLSMVDSGLHLVVEFDAHINDVDIANAAAAIGLRVYPLSNYGFGELREKGLIIGYAYSATNQISHYGKQLADLIKSALKPTP